jgi:hypothetical protein
MFGWIARAYNWATGKIDSTVAGWVHDLINGLYGFLRTIFGDVGNAWDYFWLSWQATGTSLLGFFASVGHGFYYLWHVWVPGLWHWIFIELLDPLRRAWDWIHHEGTILWYYITHPAELVAYIYDDIILRIEKLAWATAEKLGEFFLALIIKHLTTLVHVVEDIIDAVF